MKRRIGRPVPGPHHLNQICVVYGMDTISEEVVEEAIREAQTVPEEIPEYALDCHTRKGRRRGLTKRGLLVTEYRTLANRVPGICDDEMERLADGEVRLGRKRRRESFPSSDGMFK